MLERALQRDRADLGALAEANAIRDTIQREHERRQREQIPDPLRLERRALGPSRATALAEHITPRPDLEALSDAHLREQRETLATQAVPLDRIAAAHVAQLEQQRARIEKSLTAAADRAAVARAALEAGPRRDRRARASELQIHTSEHATLAMQLEQLDRKLHAALTAPNSPDTWLDRHGAANAELAQVNTKLECRKRRELARRPQRTIDRSPVLELDIARHRSRDLGHDVTLP